MDQQKLGTQYMLGARSFRETRLAGTTIDFTNEAKTGALDVGAFL